MADDITYTSTNPAGVPDATKQATDEHVTRGHMPIVKVAYSADGDATLVPADANGLKVNTGQYAEDTAHVTGDLVTMAGVVQQTADAALSSDGDRSLLQVDASGFLKVNIKAGAGAGGTAMVDDAAFTPAVTSFTPSGAMFDDVAPDSVNEGDGGVLRMSANRNLYTQIRDGSSERSAAVTAGNALVVDGSGATQPVSGTVTADTELPTAAALADNTANPTAPAVGAFLMGWDGATWDRVPATAADGALVNLGGNNDVTVTSGAVTVSQATASSLNAEVQGDAAHDAPVSGNPVLMGFRANANEPAVVSADNDAVSAWADLFGRLVTVSGHPNPEAPITINATASGNTTVIAAPGAGSLYIQKGSIHNSGSANITVKLQDGTGGTDRWAAELASEGGGSLFDFGDRGWKLTATTLLNVNLSAGGDVRINITSYYIAP